MQQIEADRGHRRENYLIQLHHNTLLRHNFYALLVSRNGIECLLLNIEAQLRGKAHGAHHTQGVVREGYIGVAGRANDAILKVIHTLKRIDQLAKAVAIQTPRHSVDSKVAAALVLLQRARLDLRLARVVGIRLLTRTDKLHLRAVSAHHSGAKSLEDRHLALHLASQSLGYLNTATHDHDVDVGRGAVQVVVAHISAHHVGLHAKAIDNGGNLAKDGVFESLNILFHRELYYFVEAKQRRYNCTVFSNPK